MKKLIALVHNLHQIIGAKELEVVLRKVRKKGPKAVSEEEMKELIEKAQSLLNPKVDSISVSPESRKTLKELGYSFKWIEEYDPNWNEEDVPEEDVPEEDVPEEDVPEEDVPEEDVPEEDVPEEKPKAGVPKKEGSMADYIDHRILEKGSWEEIVKDAKKAAKERNTKTLTSAGAIKSHIKYRISKTPNFLKAHKLTMTEKGIE